MGSDGDAGSKNHAINQLTHFTRKGKKRKQTTLAKVVALFCGSAVVGAGDKH